ncbi:MAG: hypothetical protein AAGJ46_11890 [Planctomycetota bacterium]
MPGLSFRLFLAGIAAGLLLTGAARASEAEEAVAEALARKMFTQFLSDNESIEITGQGVEGKATAVDPAENLEVEVDDLESGYGTATCKMKFGSLFRLKGKLTGDDETPVSALAKLSFTADGFAEIRQQGDQVELSGKIDNLKGEVAELDDVEPEDLPDAKGVVEKALRENLEKLQREINQWLADNPANPNQTE